MTGVHPPESDLWVPRPAPGEVWDPAMLSTHYHGIHIPSERIGAYIYSLNRPAFGTNQGGVLIFRGEDHHDPLDIEYLDYGMTQSWPTVDANSLTLENGLRIEFVELGPVVRLTYRSPDGGTWIDVTGEAVTPLFARGHIIPGEDVDADPAMSPSGSEQMMHMTGELVLHGTRYQVDCYNPRDRSWGQVRTESMQRRAKAPTLPPVGWTPMYFGPDLIFNSAGYVPASTNPNWLGLYDVDPAKPAHYFAWMIVDGAEVEITSVIRTVTEYHPVLYSAARQRVDVEIADGRRFSFTGETTAMCNGVAWPNAAIRIGTSHWVADDGRECDNTYQEMWFDHVHQREMNRRSGRRIAGLPAAVQEIARELTEPVQLCYCGTHAEYHADGARGDPASGQDPRR